MSKYSTERKAAILKKLLPPESRTVKEVAIEEGIHFQTLYSWLNIARDRESSVPDKKLPVTNWSAEMKFSVIVETASFTEAELSQYCREKGIYPEQVKTWKVECLQGFKSSKEQKKAELKQAQVYKHENKQLKKELRRKEKALAETAALLVLRKKLNALWEEDEES